MIRSLSKNEAKVVLPLEWEDRQLVDLGYIRNALSITQGYARFLAHSLVKKGWLRRLSRGAYLLIPADRGLDGIADMNPYLAGKAVLGAPHFYSYGTACTHHGLTEQSFSEFYVASRGRSGRLTVGDAPFILARVEARRFFGFEDAKVLGVEVPMATPERALLDAIDRPRYAGGIGEVSGMVGRAGRRISWNRLLRFLSRWRCAAPAQRLGYLTDLHGVALPARAKRRLRGLASRRGKIHLGARATWGTSGTFNDRWGIIENVSRSVLLGTREDNP